MFMSRVLSSQSTALGVSKLQSLLCSFGGSPKQITDVMETCWNAIRVAYHHDIVFMCDANTEHANISLFTYLRLKSSQLTIQIQIVDVLIDYK